MPHEEDELTTGRTLVALFTMRAQAQAAIHDLRDHGFTPDQIGVASHEPEVAPQADEAAVGAIAGGVLGSLVGLISSFLIPGLGPVLVGGVLASLVGAGVGAATGGIVGTLAGIGVPEHEARYFDAALRTGGTLVTVNVGTRLNDALAILQRHKADLGVGAERRVAGEQPYTGPERRLTRV